MPSFIFESAPFPSCHASTLVEVSPGRLLAAWFGGRDEGARDVKIWWSRYDGRAWDKPTIAAEESGQPCWNPVLFELPDGTLALWYKSGPSPQTWTGFVRHSVDGGKSWSLAEILPAGQYGPVRAKPIVLADGTLLAATSVESHRCWTAYVDRSRDGGRTWTRSAPIAVPGRPRGLIQPTLFVAKTGRVVALCRSADLGRVARSESADGGAAWTPAAPTSLPNPNSGIDCARGGSGELFLLYNHTPAGRWPLNLARSADDGATWTPVLTVEGGSGEFSYPALIAGSDGRLHLTYTWNRTHIAYRAVDPAAPKG